MYQEGVHEGACRIRTRGSIENLNTGEYKELEHGRAYSIRTHREFETIECVHNHTRKEQGITLNLEHCYKTQSKATEHASRSS